jgi:phage terminase large subunit-like protein
MALREFQYGMKIAEGKIKDPTTFFYHRATSDENAKFDTMENRIKALKEASGPEAAKFRDLFSVAKEWDDENADHSYLERVWCNRWVQSSTSAFDAKKFRELGDESLKIAPGSTIVLGFDGAISDDSTALVATEVETGIQNLVGIWEKPEGATRWQVPVGEVNAVMEDMFEFYNVLKLYADPPYWQESISKWAGRWEKRVVEWPTRNETHIYYALRAYSEAINMGEVGHDNNQALIDHIAASGKNLLNRYDDEGKQKYRLAKRQRDKKIDAAMAAVLSWQARLDALSEGAQEEEEQYVPRRIR